MPLGRSVVRRILLQLANRCVGYLVIHAQPAQRNTLQVHNSAKQILVCVLRHFWTNKHTRGNNRIAFAMVEIVREHSWNLHFLNVKQNVIYTSNCTSCPSSLFKDQLLKSTFQLRSCETEAWCT